MWGESFDNVWAVGDNRTIVQYNGSAWSTFAGSLPAGPTNLTAVHGAGETVMILGDNPLGIYRLSGGNFEAMSFEATIPSTVLKGLWVMNSSLAWAIGSPCTILRWDGGDWYQVPCPSGPQGEDLSAAGLRGIRGGNGQLYISASGGCFCEVGDKGRLTGKMLCNGPDALLRWSKTMIGEGWTALGDLPPGGANGPVLIPGPIVIPWYPECFGGPKSCNNETAWERSGSEWLNVGTLARTSAVGTNQTAEDFVATMNEVTVCTSTSGPTATFCSRKWQPTIEPVASCADLQGGYNSVWAVSTCKIIAVGDDGRYMVRP